MKRLLSIIFLLLIFSMGCIEKGGDMNLEGKKILMIVAFENFRDEEFEIPYETFRSAGASVTVASWQTGTARGMLGKTLKINTTIYDVNVDDYDAVVFIGGSGAQEYYTNERALEIAREAYEGGKVLGAICLAPGILAKAGVLKDKKATIWDDGSGRFAKILEENGAHYTGRSLEIEGNVITANGPHAANEFANAIMHALQNQ